ncbi:MAG: monofunctional biosynthetic peptidoglycan transglycosylase [Candidatus Fibromonas sp.]|jgi:monofunctional biosynthetic peptidoglycan transglycosylase|nr:monofunctional biosynthetic peptidoglycan transglycosylase [Candidatus Fibromonas sp.]
MEKALKVLRITYRILNQFLRLVLLIFILYSIAFSLACTYGAWKVYVYGKTILKEVQVLKDSQPDQSAFMKDLQEKSPMLKIRQRFVPMDSISPYLQKAVIAGEDAAFYFHPGFDVRAIAEALDANQKRNKTMFGASTITQQLAKNMFLTNERSWERKFKEFAYAILMEKYLGKDRILELYLNYAQWGQSIFGCEEAAQKHYKKSCAKLSIDQSINLVAMLASPGKHHPEMRESRFMQQRRNMIYRNMFPPKDSLLVDSLRSLVEPLPKENAE